MNTTVTVPLWELVFVFTLGVTVGLICCAILLGVAALRATANPKAADTAPHTPVEPAVVVERVPARPAAEDWLPNPVRPGQAPLFDQLASRLPQQLAPHRTQFREFCIGDPYATGAFPVLSELEDDTEVDPPTPARDRFSYQPIPGSTAVLDRPKSKRKGRKPQQVTVTVAGETRSRQVTP